MNVLDMLQAYLQQAQSASPQISPSEEEGLLSEAEKAMIRGTLLSSPGPLPSYLPEAVRRSIQSEPSYAEGQRMPTVLPTIGQEAESRLAPQRDAGLATALGRARVPGRIMSDSDAWLRSYYDYSNNGYPGALNSMMGRYPLALY